MTNSTPNTKALLSAIIGLLAAALIVGTISFGPALGQSLQGQDLATSAQAREGFVVAEASTKASTTALNKTPAATTTTTTTTTDQQPATPAAEGNYAVAAAEGDYDEDTDYESEDD